MWRGARLLPVFLLGIASACSSGPRIADPTTTVPCPARVDLVDEPCLSGDPLQALDLYQPPSVGCEAVPLVVWVHGGGWSAGDKANGMPPKVDLWTAEGWAVASLSYRLTDRTARDGERLLAPAHNQDVAAALAADPAYLAAVELEPADLARAAPLDTEGFDIAGVVEGGGAPANLYQLVFGSDPARWDELSPRSHLGEAEVPDLFLVRRGEPSRRAQVDGFATAARAAGAWVTVVELPTFSHADVSHRIGDTSDHELTPALQGFRAECLGGSGL